MILLDPIVLAAFLATGGWVYLLHLLLRRPANPALRCAFPAAVFTASSLCLGLLIYGSQNTYPVTDATRWTSVVQHLCATTAIFLGYGAYAFMAYQRRDAHRLVRRHGAVFLIVQVAQAVFGLAGTPEDFSAGYVADYHNAPLTTVYLVLFTGYASVMAAGGVRMSARWSKSADDPWMRRGLVAGGCGFAVACVYCAVRTAFMVLAVLGDPIPVKEGAVTGWLVAVAVPMVLISTVLPGWGPRLGAAVRWWRLHRAHRRLYPLWSALTEAHPHVRMSVGPSPFGTWLRRRPFAAALADRWDDAWSPHDLDLRLHLRVMQIWDARRALLDHCDDIDYDRAVAQHQRLRPGIREAHAEAAMLAAGLERHRTGTPPAGRVREPRPARAETLDLAANVDWLEHVAKALRRLI